MLSYEESQELSEYLESLSYEEIIELISRIEAIVEMRKILKQKQETSSMVFNDYEVLQ